MNARAVDEDEQTPVDCPSSRQCCAHALPRRAPVAWASDSGLSIASCVGMTKKREPTQTDFNNTTNSEGPVASKTVARDAAGTDGKSTRGTAAALRAGAGSATKAKARTSKSKLSQKELTKRGGPGRAGTNATQAKKSAP